MWLNKGQDSISVFGHGAGSVAKGVSWFQCGLPVEKSRQSLNPPLWVTHLFTNSSFFSATYCFLHVLLFFLISPFQVLSASVFPWKLVKDRNAWQPAQTCLFNKLSYESSFLFSCWVLYSIFWRQTECSPCTPLIIGCHFAYCSFLYEQWTNGTKYFIYKSVKKPCSQTINTSKNVWNKILGL